MSPDEVIIAFVSYLKENGNPGLVLDRWPDKENSTSPDIDAIAGEFVIEHTSIDIIDGMREKNDWFMKAVGNLEIELNPTMKSRLRIIIDYEAIDKGKGQSWEDIRTRIREWIIKETDLLNEGVGRVKIEGVPFELNVEKTLRESPGLVFSRSVRKELETLESSIGPHLERKAKKLRLYSQDGLTRVLLIQSEDVALMNRIRLVKAIEVAFPRGLPEGVDQIWYADVTIPGHLLFHNLMSHKE